MKLALKAADRGNAKITLLLLQHGADVNATDEQGTTPLHQAVLDNDQKKAEILLKYNAQLDVLSYKTGLSPLTLAAREGNLKMIELMVGSQVEDKAPSS